MTPSAPNFVLFLSLIFVCFLFTLSFHVLLGCLWVTGSVHFVFHLCSAIRFVCHLCSSIVIVYLPCDWLYIALVVQFTSVIIIISLLYVYPFLTAAYH